MVSELEVETQVRKVAAAEFVRDDSVNNEIPMAAEVGIL